MSRNSKWLKIFLELTEKLQWICDDIVKYSYTIFSNKFFFGAINNNYIIKNRF